MEFWSELLTKASWEKLIQLSKEIRFTLIGGWAAYLWTGLHKSKDIDIIVDYEDLLKLQQTYRLEKNDRLKKYEIKFDKFDIDIYLPGYSNLAIPAEDVIKNYSTKIEGINTIIPEALLILKQGAEIERRNTVKGKKDAIDILTLLIHAPFNLKRYNELLSKYKKQNYIEELATVIKNFDDRDIKYLSIDFITFKKWKSKMLEELKRL
ncbi:MAG: hypothetical protein QXW80_00300 [Candidatus Micrarchaeia archaeon]